MVREDFMADTRCGPEHVTPPAEPSAELGVALISALGDLHPVLGDQVRLKKMPSCCWLVDGLANGERIHPLEAFVLALCTGENSREDLVYLVEHTLEKDTGWSKQLVDLTLGNRASHLKAYRSRPLGTSGTSRRSTSTRSATRREPLRAGWTAQAS